MLLGSSFFGYKKHSISRMEQPLIVCQSLQDTIVGLVLKKDRHRNFSLKSLASF
jgi:hypothetical protein